MKRAREVKRKRASEREGEIEEKEEEKEEEEDEAEGKMSRMHYDGFLEHSWGRTGTWTRRLFGRLLGVSWEASRRPRDDMFQPSWGL